MEQENLISPAPTVAIQAGTVQTVAIRQTGPTGWITLNRPSALNALNGEMVRAIQQTLNLWRDDPAVTAIILQGTGRAFCAGADVRRLREAVLADDMDVVETFFREEYALDHTIATYPKPVLTLVDGLCVGGGMGLAMHAHSLVATRAASFGMPETAIGLFPDVGASQVLPQLRGRTGLYMALTGRPIPAEMAHAAGLLTHLWPGDMSELVAGLERHGLAALVETGLPVPSSAFDHVFSRIDTCFSGTSLMDILDALANETSQWGEETLAAIREKSPAALCWTFEMMRTGQKLTLQQALNRDLAMAMTVTRLPDFAEGIRALLVDKDRTPRWQDARVEDVDPAMIASVLKSAASYPGTVC
ncbi:enoyl-CoA hydratase/isomerase family protein [Granulibacter bethesdensis]|uniref:enoyl-CoA hydratase/isomerase family protein n=1 Tax=Granulibacter bethesdensis TaxID=364410 RepID=UPI00090B1DCC|nr:enoyl-CoA hydratase/isomerase family protein [Granulibacter bethesdensis]APH60144.1 3-hydroxyisobutyryl-CoA hydrolase [Granulibacter bethesdensis]